MTHADILDSKYSSELLAFLLLAPARCYSSKELAERMGLSVKSLDILLKEFLDDSMIKQFVAGQTKLYIINHKHKIIKIKEDKIITMARNSLNTSLISKSNRLPTRIIVKAEKFDWFSRLLMLGIKNGDFIFVRK